eukprot:4434161-Pleurochrysis_carterae.AAC.2
MLRPICLHSRQYSMGAGRRLCLLYGRRLCLLHLDSLGCAFAGERVETTVEAKPQPELLLACKQPLPKPSYLVSEAVLMLTRYIPSCIQVRAT